MLGAGTEADKARGDSAQEREPSEEPADEWKLVARAGCSPSDAAVNKDLHALNHAHRPFSARLHLLEIRQRNWSRSQFRGEQIRGRDGILQCEVDADSAGRRHGVRAVADAKQTFAGPT